MPSRTADHLLMLLKTRGSLTTRGLAEALGISVPAVRQHLRALDAEVRSETVNQGVGRPAQQWSLTAEAQRRFPDTHAELAVRLIGFIEQGLGAEALETVLDGAYQNHLERYAQRLESARTLAARVKRLAAMRSDEGYMAEATRAGRGWLLVEHHCPIGAAARACGGLCRDELALFRSVLGRNVHVERREHLLDGGTRCTYYIGAAEADRRASV